MEEKKHKGGARKGAGRPSLFKGEMKRKITLSLTYKAVEILNGESGNTGCSRSDILNDLVINYLTEKKEETTNEFNNGIWSSVQFLVLSHNETELAKLLIKESGLTKQDCVKAQTESDFESDVMAKFINTVFPTVEYF